jgi:NTE family protein
MKKVGIALGGGGAKGLAHIAMLEVLDELGVAPRMISGTSIGAIIGALYAAGHSAAQLREAIGELTATPKTLRELVQAKRLPAWLDFIDVDVGRSSLLKVDAFLSELEEVLGVSTFEKLSIPLKVVAADFWAREEVVFDAGPIIPAVAASFALPGIFKPVVIGDRVLVDGGSVNPLPYDLLLDDCDIVVAVDVIGRRTPGAELIPSYSETLFNTFQIAEKAILNEKIKACAPTIYIEPEIREVRVLEFHKADRIYEQSKPAQDLLRRELRALI